ncbi:TPA: tail fiber assembly protein [Klebsiella pneumoniae subsp. pneumoniae]|uniref:tail fiber assembly protein n=1 Tax=Klebsiella pneumoniae TaxID=573 RepID=UPI001034958C|nr:tail fiber assembly protein [Klebsiella pneumoniae]HDU4554695.1 tail fiber assembly protein [Klebsiella pneumoniae subsp. pneumoniae]ELA2164198.1 tail fiber assembly protein [Klebsiella pneumoniae]MCD9722459.1 tail fiber assembly protein [Klebsiella pneumoniae]MCJ4933266.1 tail fiber assembly protein [Klebsiella pneumoniae]MCL7676277.1 tail fiber assembly protein [Klebsiella pneumoniae]
MKSWAIIKDGVVINTFLWDGEGVYQHEEGTTLVEYDDSNIAGPGYLYDGKSFSRPPLTDEEQAIIDKQNIESVSAMKQRLIDEATLNISILQDAIDMEMATDDEKASLSSWKKYRVLLNRVDVSGKNISWPSMP